MSGLTQYETNECNMRACAFVDLVWSRPERALTSSMRLQWPQSNLPLLDLRMLVPAARLSPLGLEIAERVLREMGQSLASHSPIPNLQQPFLLDSLHASLSHVICLLEDYVRIGNVPQDVQACQCEKPLSLSRYSSDAPRLQFLDDRKGGCGETTAASRCLTHRRRP